MCNLFCNIAAKQVEKRMLRVLLPSFKLINNCCKIGLNVGGKTRNIAFLLVCSNILHVFLSVLPSL